MTLKCSVCIIPKGNKITYTDRRNIIVKIVVLDGGISTERDVSLVSGAQIYKALKERGHQVVLLDVFLGYEEDASDVFSLDKDWAAEAGKISKNAPDIAAVKAARKNKANVLFGDNVLRICRDADIVFMALHGDCGENGKIQATFDLFDIKYTGTDYLSSALAMDKSYTKQVFTMNGIRTPAAKLLSDRNENYMPEFPAVVKVCSGGSSVGVYIVNNSEEYDKALDEAFKYENKVLVEQYIKGRELTDCVAEGVALPVVEITPREGFYDYSNKYQEGAAIETCPADLGSEKTEEVQRMAVAAYNALGIKTYARMDFIMDEKGDVYCLEANTLPGMTPTSLVPQEAAAIGKSFPELCEWIVEMSLRKYN